MWVQFYLVSCPNSHQSKGWYVKLLLCCYLLVERRKTAMEWRWFWIQSQKDSINFLGKTRYFRYWHILSWRVTLEIKRKQHFPSDLGLHGSLIKSFLSSTFRIKKRSENIEGSQRNFDRDKKFRFWGLTKLPLHEKTDKEGNESVRNRWDRKLLFSDSLKCVISVGYVIFIFLYH
jgi:hypothetical protein